MKSLSSKAFLATSPIIVPGMKIRNEIEGDLARKDPHTVIREHAGGWTDRQRGRHAGIDVKNLMQQRCFSVATTVFAKNPKSKDDVACMHPQTPDPGFCKVLESHF